MSRVERIGDATLYLGDCLEILPTLPKVDAVITDPPYSSGGMFRGDRQMDVLQKYVQTGSSSHDRLLGFTGDNRDQFGYWYTIAMWLGMCRAASADGAICGLFCDWRQLIATCGALQTGGFVFRGVVPWYKPNGRPTQGRWANQCEFVVWGTNGPRELAGRAFPGFYQYPFIGGDERQHVTQKPIELMRDLLMVVPEQQTVLDFCMGAGTTGVACAETGRKFIGIEIEPRYFDIACERIDNAYRQQRMFA